VENSKENKKPVKKFFPIDQSEAKLQIASLNSRQDVLAKWFLSGNKEMQLHGPAQKNKRKTH
jgi:hypothetical protein